MTTLLIPYALKNGAIVHVEDVARGLSCGCICPSCKGTLVKRVCVDKRDHFAHASGSCNNSLETTLHILSKQLISEAESFTYPGHLRLLRVEISAASREVSKAGCRFDVSLNPGTPSEVLIEVVVTNKVSREKLLRVLSLNVPVIEVTVPREAIMWPLADLKDYLTVGVNGKRLLSRAPENPASISPPLPQSKPHLTADQRLLIPHHLVPSWSKFYKKERALKASCEEFVALHKASVGRRPTQEELNAYFDQLITSEKGALPESGAPKESELSGASAKSYREATRGS